MSDSDGATGGDGRRHLSRRKILWGLATTGAAASAGGSSAALLADREGFGSTQTAGTLDLETSPSWGNNSGLTATDREREETVEITLSDNPGYLWFRTACKQCTKVEETLHVTITLDTHGDGTDGTIYSGSLGAVREELGSGVLLDGSTVPGGEFPAGSTWTITVAWWLEEPMYTPADLSFDFEYHVTQSRHVDDPTEFAPSWTCEDCSDDGTGDDPKHDISWVAFCAAGEPDLAYGEDGNLVISGSTLTYDLAGLSDGVTINAIVVKYGGPGGGSLYVYDSPGDTGSLPQDGQGSWHDARPGDGFEGTNRSNSVPCPEDCWYKYEVSEMKATRKCGGTQSAQPDENGEGPNGNGPNGPGETTNGGDTK